MSASANHPTRMRVGMARLPSLGFLSRGDLLEIADRLGEFRDDPGVGAVLLHGTASLFCSGLDLQEFCNVAALDELAAALERCFLAFADLRKPLVIAVDGLACGFGATMLCHADVVIASARSRMRMPFLDLGLIPEAGSTLLLRERIGHLNAYRLLCLAEEIDAAEAKRIGFVTKVEHEDAVEFVAMRDALCLARRPRALLAATTDLLMPARPELPERIRTEMALSFDQLRDSTVQKRLVKLSAAGRARAHRADVQSGAMA